MIIDKTDKIMILGGDERIEELIKLYQREGYRISTYGHENLQLEGVKEYETIKEGIQENNTIIGPIPFNWGDKINMKLSGKAAFTESFINLLDPDKKLILGAPDSYFIDLAQKKKLAYLDYNKDECFQIFNAAATAEGAISVIINERNTTIYKSSILVIGYGRIGKVLAGHLKAFNPELYVAARKNTDVAWIDLNGYKGLKTDEIDKIIGDMDIIINTVPALIIPNMLVDAVKEDALIIDLASKPGGLDHSYAIGKGIKIIHALGLPGKISPKSAAKIIFDTIFILH